MHSGVSFFMREIVYASVQWIENYYDENERRERVNTEFRTANTNCMQSVRSAKMYRNQCVDVYTISNGFQCYTNIVYFGYDAIVRWNGIQRPILKTFYAIWMEFTPDKNADWKQAEWVWVCGDNFYFVHSSVRSSDSIVSLTTYFVGGCARMRL